MAGEWIKVRTNLWNDPRISQVCDLTNERKATVIGALYWLWASADEHTETGLMPGLSLKGIDRETNIAGFGTALVIIGWVEDTPQGTILVRFNEHNGASAKNRAQTAKRVANSRNGGDVTPVFEKCNAATVTGALPREEKRRDKEEGDLLTPTTSDTPVGKKSKSAAGSRLPEDWKPSQADIEYCKTERPDLLPSLVATNFYEHWMAKSGKDATKTRWDLTWRTWVRRESVSNAGRQLRPGVAPGGQAKLSLVEQNAANTEEARRLLFGASHHTTTDNDEGMVLEHASS